MSLPKYLTTVTPFSKTVALGLLVIYPFFGFFLGYKYASIDEPEIRFVDKIKVEQVNTLETPLDLLSRCGDLPLDSKLGITGDHYTQLDGPFWSPDCRNVAWSSWQSGTSVPYENSGLEYQGPYKHEGLFIYNEASKIVKKVYFPIIGERVVIQGWKDSSTIEFTKGGVGDVYIYDLSTQSVKENQI